MTFVAHPNAGLCVGAGTRVHGTHFISACLMCRMLSGYWPYKGDPSSHWPPYLVQADHHHFVYAQVPGERLDRIVFCFTFLCGVVLCFTTIGGPDDTL